MRIAVMGGGIGGLAAAALLAKDGHTVTVYEKNEVLGGRAGVFEEQGFRFDMGPSWYLMPDVFEKFFTEFGLSASEQLKLKRLDPSYRVYFEGKKDYVDMPADLDKASEVVEGLEPGSKDAFLSYLAASGRQYRVIMDFFLYKPFFSIFSVIGKGMIRATFTIPLFGSVHRYVKKRFKSLEVQKLLEYTLVFLGASPYQAPAFYTMMGHVDFGLGVFYPENGIGTLIEKIVEIGTSKGVKYVTGKEVEEIGCVEGAVRSLIFKDGEEVECDLVITNADMHHTETRLLPKQFRTYSKKYWRDRTLAPSALLLYVGVRGTLPELEHHTLYFTEKWEEHFDAIFKDPKWPENPSFYVCAPSKTDPTVAPAGHENLFVFVPIAAEPELFEDMDGLADRTIEHMSTVLAIPDLKERIVYRKVFGPHDFEERYNSFKGSALGLAHVFSQTAFLRPKSRSKKLSNLYYVGAGVHPGIGMPVSVVSAHIVRDLIRKNHNA